MFRGPKSLGFMELRVSKIAPEGHCVRVTKTNKMVVVNLTLLVLGSVLQMPGLA